MGNKLKKNDNKPYMRYVKTISTPTYLEITKESNMNTKDIDKAMKQLVDAGLIKVDGDVIHIYEPINWKI